MNLQAKTELLKRFSNAPHVEGYKSTVAAIFELGLMIDSAKKHASADLHLSDAGRVAYVAKMAVDNVPTLVQVTAAARKAGRFNTDRRANLKPPLPPRDDIVGELQ